MVEIIGPNDSNEVIKEKAIGYLLFFAGLAAGALLGAGSYSPLFGLVTSFSYLIFLIKRHQTAARRADKKEKVE